MVEGLLSMCEALGSVPSTEKRKMEWSVCVCVCVPKLNGKKQVYL